MRPAEIRRLLPDIFQRTAQPGGPLAALIEAMSGLQQPSENALANLDSNFDAYRAPERFVPILAGWVDLDWLLVTGSGEGIQSVTYAPGSGQLRELIAAAVSLSRWRGTARGLQQFLETATGVVGYEIQEQVLDGDGRPRPFHLRVTAPPGAAQYEGLIEQIIDEQKPAYATAELQFRATEHTAR
jgi:phage tail-like protein